jgi:hypothetical protein
MVLDHWPIKIKKWVADKIKGKEGIEYRKETYNVIENFMLGVDHVSVYVSRYCGTTVLSIPPTITCRIQWWRKFRPRPIDRHLLYRHLTGAGLLWSTQGH